MLIVCLGIWFCWVAIVVSELEARKTCWSILAGVFPAYATFIIMCAVQ